MLHPHHVRRLMSTEYSELREKLHAPIRSATNVVIHQTISELFLDTFKAHAELNQPYMLPSEMVNIINNMHINHFYCHIPRLNDDLLHNVLGLCCRK